MIDPVCSITNIRNSVELHFFKLLAETDGTLLINKEDYNVRFPELLAAKMGFLWNLTDISRTHHWSAQLYVGATTFQDFGQKQLLSMTDSVKYALDCSLYIPVYDYAKGDFESNINTLVMAGPVKWLPIFREPNDFNTSMFVATLKYAQPGYL